MTNRTVQFLGQGFGDTPVSLTVTANNETVFDGVVSTLAEPLPEAAWPEDDSVSLFVLQIPVDFSGSFPMTIKVKSGWGIKFVTATANYVPVPNPVYTPEQFAIVTSPDGGQQALDIVVSLATPPFTQEEIDVLANPDTPEPEYRALLSAHGVSIYVSGGDDFYDDMFWPGDSRTDVTLDGNPVEPPDPRPDGLDGDWTWTVPVDSTLTFNFHLDAGLE
jgi:hypothetical protein